MRKYLNIRFLFVGVVFACLLFMLKRPVHSLGESTMSWEPKCTQSSNERQNIHEAAPKCIYEKTLARYAAMKKYQARGQILRSVLQTTADVNDRTQFNIIFQEPDYLRLEWSTTDYPLRNLPNLTKKNPELANQKLIERGIFEQRGTTATINIYNGDDGLLKETKVHQGNPFMAFADLQGKARGEFILPTLLLQKTYPLFLRRFNLSGVEFEEDERVDGIDCYVITGKNEMAKIVKNGPYYVTTMWISKEGVLIRQIEEKTVIPANGSDVVKENVITRNKEKYIDLVAQ